MTGLQAAILAACEAELLTGRRWGQPPAIYFLNVQRHGPALRRAKLPAGFWHTHERPAGALAALADRAGIWAPVLQAAAPPALYGIGFAAEAWEILTMPDDSDAKRRQDHIDAQEHRLYARPDRAEIATLVAVDRAGLTYSCSRRRDTGTLEREMLRRDPEHSALGVVPDALDQLVQSMLGVMLPPRPEEPEFFRAAP